MKTFDQAALDGHGDAASAHRVAPGRTTATARLAPRPIVNGAAEPGAGSRGTAAGADAAVDRAAALSGAPLRDDLQQRFASSLGADLSRVRIHNGAESAQAASAIGARAYAVGQDIHFGAGQYQPDDPFGMHLLAHEVAHTVQQAGGPPQRQHKLEVSSPSDAAEYEADRAADAMVQGQPARVSASAGIRLQRFAPEGHQKATIGGLKNTFSADEIGQIVRANWERDFSQGSPKFGSMVLAWKKVKRSAHVDPDQNPSKAAAQEFKSAAEVVIKMSVLEVTHEALGGYRSWEHMDRPKKGDEKKAKQRWGAKRGALPGYIADSKAYIKDMLVSAVHAYRKATGKTAVEPINNWGGVEKPAGYDTPKEDANGPMASSKIVAGDARVAARNQGAAATPRPPGNPFGAAADQLGRATHAIEDFFSHSNWLELARQVKRGGKPTEALHTGTFSDHADKAHALGHKLISLADALIKDFEILRKVYDNRQQGNAKTKAKSLRSFGGTALVVDHYQSALRSLNNKAGGPTSEMMDVALGSSDVEQALLAGTCDLGDFLVDKDFLRAIKTKGRRLMEQGDKDGAKTGHAKMAKDAPTPGKEIDHAAALGLARQADRLLVGPLREVMGMKNARAAKKKLVKQLELVDRILAAPSAGHPLIKYVTGGKK